MRNCGNNRVLKLRHGQLAKPQHFGPGTYAGQLQGKGQNAPPPVPALITHGAYAVVLRKPARPRALVVPALENLS